MKTNSGRRDRSDSGDMRLACTSTSPITESGGGSPGGMTLEELLALPVAMDLVTAGRAWQLGRTKCHELARADRFPCRVLRVGNQYRVTRADLLASLGIDQASSQRDVERAATDRPDVAVPTQSTG